jgi:hypothetical protein
VATGCDATGVEIFACADFGTGGVPPFGPPAAGAAVVPGVAAVTEPGVVGEYVLKNSIHSAVTEDGSL